MAARSYRRARRRSSATSSPTRRPPASARLGRRPHEARADDHAVGARVGRRGRAPSGVRDAEAERDGHVRARLACARGRRPARRRAPRARPSCRSPRRCRRSRARGAPIAASRSSRRRRRHERDQRDARPRRRPRARRRASSSGRSGTIRPLIPRCGELVGEALDAAREDEVRVAHSTTGTTSASAAADVEHAGTRRAGGQRGGAGGVDHRAVGERVGERHAELDQVGAGAPRRPRRSPASASEVGEAAHQVGHQRARAWPCRERGGDASCRRPAAARSRRGSSTSARSLSPRPERQTRSSASSPRRRVGEHPGDRVRGLERGDDPLQLGERAEGRQRVGVRDRLVARAAGVAQPRVLRARRRGSRGRRRSSAPR